MRIVRTLFFFTRYLADPTRDFQHLQYVQYLLQHNYLQPSP